MGKSTVKQQHHAGRSKIRTNVKPRDRYKSKMGNLTEGQGFANRKKVEVVREYTKIKRKQFKSKARASNTTSPETCRKSTSSKKQSAFSKATKLHQKTQDLKLKKRQELEATRKMKEEALTKYKHKKMLQYKKVHKKNYKGQPNLSAQMELLLEKIQQNR